MTTTSRFAIPLSGLEQGARVDVTEQVQEQPEPRLHASWNAVPDGAGGGAPGCDGE